MSSDRPHLIAGGDVPQSDDSIHPGGSKRPAVRREGYGENGPIVSFEHLLFLVADEVPELEFGLF